jgi:hypothetical protein
MLAKAFGLPPTSHDAHQSSSIIPIFIAKCTCFHYMDIVHWRVACPNFLFQQFFVFSRYPCVRTPDAIINCYLIINAINGTTCPFSLINIFFGKLISKSIYKLFIYFYIIFFYMSKSRFFGCLNYFLRFL